MSFVFVPDVFAALSFRITRATGRRSLLATTVFAFGFNIPFARPASALRFSVGFPEAALLLFFAFDLFSRLSALLSLLLALLTMVLAAFVAALAALLLLSTLLASLLAVPALFLLACSFCC